MGNAGAMLIADDEPNILRLTRMVFERVGFQVSEAIDGEEAIETTRLHHALELFYSVLHSERMKAIHQNSDSPSLSKVASSIKNDWRQTGWEDRRHLLCG